MPKVEEQASFDGNQQNSGIINFDEQSGGYIVTKTAKERYQNLVDIYGSTMVPPVLRDSGISVYQETDKYLMSAEAMSNFIILTQKKKGGE